MRIETLGSSILQKGCSKKKIEKSQVHEHIILCSLPDLAA